MIFSVIAPATSAWPAPAWQAPSSMAPQPSYPGDVPPGGLPAGPTTVPPSSDPIADDVHDAPARVVSGAAQWDSFGAKVTPLGDLNGDGAGELAVVSRNPWAVNVMVATSSGYDRVSTIKLTGGVGDIFGAQVAGEGDLNGDGFGDLAIVVGRIDGTGRYAYQVYVYYGSQVLGLAGPSVMVPAPTMGASFGSGVAIVDDMDGDSFDDLVVTASPGPSSPEKGMAWIYRGSAGGLIGAPAWSFTFPNVGTAFGAGAFSAGDLNADGRGDFVVTTGGADTADGRAEVYIFYGADLLGLEPPAILRGESAGDGFGASVSYGDLNGDGRADLLVGAAGYDAGSELQDAGRLYVYSGTMFGVSSSPYYRTGSPGTKFASSVAGLGDVNGDGYGDAAVGAPLASADGPVTNGQVFVFFGSSSGLSTTYDITEAGQSGNDLYGITVAGRMDLDADGRVDIAVGASGRDAGGFTDAGSVYLYAGLRLRLPALTPDNMRILGLTDGKALARAPSAYRLEVTFVYRGPLAKVQTVEQTIVLPTSGQRIALSWDASAGVAQESGDFGKAIEIAPSSYLVSSTPLIHSFSFSVPVKFGWSVKEPRAVGVESLVRDVDGGTTGTTLGTPFTVVSGLAFSSSLKVKRSDGATVMPGDFVRGGDALTWSGGGLVYTGTAVVPPSSELAAEVSNEEGAPTPLSVDGATGDLWGVRQAKAAEDPADLHTVSIRGATGELLAQASMLIGTDISTPTFGATSVASGTRVTESPAPISIHVLDPLAGVDGNAVEWSSSQSLAVGFSSWRAASSAFGVDVEASASVPLSEGVLTWIQFRAHDRVGNGYGYSAPFNVTLDYGTVLFVPEVPAPGAWSLTEDVPISVRISSDRALPIDLGTLEYLLAGASSTGWTNAGATGRTVQGTFSGTLTVPDSANNVLYLRVRLVDRPEIYQSPPIYLKVDTRPAAIDFVTGASAAWVTGSTAASVVVVTDTTSGPLETSIRYRYLPQGSDEWSSWIEPTLEPVAGGYRAVGLVPVRDGVDNFVVWKAQDKAGNPEVISDYQRIMGDSQRIGFERPVPVDGSKLELIERISIDITDGDGSGVDLSTVEYKVDLPGGETTGWRSAGREGLVTRATVTVAVVLPEGVSVVQWRAQDAARTPLTESLPVTLTVLPMTQPGVSPRLRLSSPLSGAHYAAGVDIKFDASGSFDPDGNRISFRWSLDGMALDETTSSFWVRLSPGEHTVTVVVDDGISQSVSKTVRFTVDGPVGPPPLFSTPGEQGMIASFVGLLVGVAALRAWNQRARRELRR